jgi:hypothetical protein
MVDELNVFGSLVGGRMPEYISGPIIFAGRANTEGDDDILFEREAW